MTSRIVAPANGFGGRWEATWPAQPSEQTDGHRVLQAGSWQAVPFSHRHTNAEEIYVILSGTGAVKLGDEVVDVRPLDAIRVAPEIARAFEAGSGSASRSSPSGSHQPGDGELVDDQWTA